MRWIDGKELVLSKEMAMKVIFAGILYSIIFFMAFPVRAGKPMYRQGVDIFIETGVDPPDKTPTWYASMVSKPNAPVFEILATKGTQGRYYPYTYAVTLKDLVKFHGHDCEGLTHAANCCYVGFKVLFSDGIIDRSVIWGITGHSPCWSDVTAFLTGARLQYGNLAFFKDKRYGHCIILYRSDIEKAVLVTWKKGINNIPWEKVMLPEKIMWKPKVDMEKVKELKNKVRRAGGKCTPYEVDLMRYYQFVHINDILSHPLEESYQAKVLENFKWEDWIDPTKVIANPHKRADIRKRNFPFRKRPVSME
jgi:formylmethanofuran dehydrogenase subunit E